MQFLDLVHLNPTSSIGLVVSVIGGGGKTTLLDRLASECAERELSVILTSTTKFEVNSSISRIVEDETEKFWSVLERRAPDEHILAVAKGRFGGKNRLLGFNTQVVGELRRFADVVIVEADGSRQRSLKTHRQFEPVIPYETTSTIIICGADIVGEPLNDKTVHRAEMFAKKWDLRVDHTLTPEIVARELISPYSYLKNIPIHSGISIFINKADKNAVGARLLAENLKRKCEYPIFTGSLKKRQLQEVILPSPVN